MKLYRQKEFYGVKNDNGQIVFKADRITNNNDIRAFNSYFVLIEKELFFLDNNNKLNSIVKNKNLSYKTLYFQKAYLFKNDTTDGGVIVTVFDDNTFKFIEFDKFYEIYGSAFIALEKDKNLVFYQMTTVTTLYSVPLSSNIKQIKCYSYILGLAGTDASLLSYNHPIEKMFLIIFDNAECNIVYNNKILFDENIVIYNQPGNDFKYFDYLPMSNSKICPLYILSKKGIALYDLFSQSFLIDYSDILSVKAKSLSGEILFIFEFKNNLYKIYDKEFNELNKAFFIGKIQDDENVTIYDNKNELTNKIFLANKDKTEFYDSVNNIKVKKPLLTIEGKIKRIAFLYDFFVCEMFNEDIIFLDLNFKKIEFGCEFKEFYSQIKKDNLVFLKNKKTKALNVYSIVKDKFTLVDDFLITSLQSDYQNDIRSSVYMAPIYCNLTLNQIKCFLDSFNGTNNFLRFVKSCIENQVYTMDEINNLCKNPFTQFDSRIKAEVKKNWNIIFENLTAKDIKKYLTEENMSELPQLKIWDN